MRRPSANTLLIAAAFVAASGAVFARSSDRNAPMNIDQPTFLFPDKSGNRWRSRSATGWVNSEGNEVRLRGNVVLDNPGGKRMTVQTEALNVYPDANRATSDQQVTITQPGATIRGRGLEAQLDTQRVTLKSEVRARYASSIQ